MDHRWHILVGLLVVAAGVKTSADVRSSLGRAEDEDYRLPNHTLPLSYDIKIIPYLDDGNFTFDGKLTIDVTVYEATSNIVFHANQIEIDADSVSVSSDGVSYPVTSQTYDSELHFYTLNFGTNLAEGNYSIYLEYTGILSDDMSGFYRSSYTTSSGETRWLATTQLEHTYARQAFPCFDEPGIKTVFTISIAHWSNQTALSNMPADSTSSADSTIEGRVWTYFPATPLMSTYLVAFIVSDFDKISNDDESFRVWARPDAIETATYAFTVGQELLNALDSFTLYNYSTTFSKMDQIAIPDFSAGAMENWGLVTYRERLLLSKDGVVTSRNKQNIATVIAHEFAHQWFGNLVSPTLWNYLWLNEGFASFFEYYTAADVETDWRLSEQFTVTFYHPALLSDSLDTSHPLNQDVYTPSQISAISDTITYSKGIHVEAGASIIRMMGHFLGTTVFQRGLQRYLSVMAYGSATPDDLWEALTYANTLLSSPVLQTHVDIKTVMDTWTNQKGYPLVTVTRNYTTLTQEITQERFLLKGRGSSNDTTEYRWWIPFNFATQLNIAFTSTEPTNWIRAQDESVFMNGFAASLWVIYNVQQTGFYRVNYDDTNWGMIATYLRTAAWTIINVLNRAQLIDDSLNLARAGYLDYSVALPITRYLTQETAYAPWAAAFSCFTFLNTMLANSTSYDNFKSYVLSRVAPIHASLGTEEQDSDEHITKLLRLAVNSWACRMGSTTCQEEAENLLLGYYSSSEPSESTISADLKAWVYCEGLRNANASVWNFLWERYLATDFSGEQTLILTSLGCSQDTDILNDYLALSISSNSSIRSQDTYSVFTAVYTSSPSNVDVAIDFLINNYEAISEFYGGMKRIGSMLQGLAARVVSADQLQKLQEFVTEHENELGVASSAAAQAIEIAEDNLSWIEDYEEDIVTWLEEFLSQEEEESSDGSGNGATSFSVSIILITITVTGLKFM